MEFARVFWGETSSVEEFRMMSWNRADSLGSLIAIMRFVGCMLVSTLETTMARRRRRRGPKHSNGCLGSDDDSTP